MKYKLLVVSTETGVNIGDYIQALASAQFYPQIDGFIQREELSSYNGEDCKVIMNGWFMHHPENWPPSNKIHPLIVSFHLNTLARESLLSEKSIEYLKKYEPIGCRDTNTMKVLQVNGVRAYYSSCLTLTLGYKYQTKMKRKDIYFADPYFVTKWNLISIIKNGLYLMTHWNSISLVSKKYPEAKKGLRKKMILTTFYREYRKFFSEEALINARYICQQSNYYKKEFKDDGARLKEAERLIGEYASAQLVVTSRIHCALPCLGLNTPVIYTENVNQTEVSKCRLAGLRELLNIMTWKKDHLELTFKNEYPIDKSAYCNKTSWKKLSVQLINCCENFIRED